MEARASACPRWWDSGGSGILRVLGDAIRMNPKWQIGISDERSKIRVRRLMLVALFLSSAKRYFGRDWSRALFSIGRMEATLSRGVRGAKGYAVAETCLPR
jgi:hypothetical protein